MRKKEEKKQKNKVELDVFRSFCPDRLVSEVKSRLMAF